MIRVIRILRSHLCYWANSDTGQKYGFCTDPDAHFEGTDEEWAKLVEEARRG